MTDHRRGWRKSSHSAPNGDCVEVARVADGTIALRDSKSPASGDILTITGQDWRTLLTTLRLA